MNATKTDANSAESGKYCDPRHPDPIYFGADEVVRAEHEFLKSSRGRTDSNNLAGLALSGGGIRSASFCLGILQALAYRKWLPAIDYLSTVSGGGYIGSCLSYLLHRKWQVPGRGSASATQEVQFSVEQKNFPLGSAPMVSRVGKGEKRGKQDALQGMDQDPYQRYRGKLLRFLRQHANYVMPGRGITILSGIGVVVRNGLLSLAFFTAIAALAYRGLQLVHILPVDEPGAWTQNGLFVAAAMLMTLFLLAAPVYGLLTWASDCGFGDVTAYRLRRFSEVAYTWVIGLVVVFLVLGAAPYAHYWLKSRSVVSIVGGTIDWSAIAGVLSAVAGVASSVGAFLHTSRSKGRLPLGLLVAIAAAAILFALLMLGYNVAERMRGEGYGWWAATVVVLALGWLVNLNYLSLHRFYRDRLTETFMPNVGHVLSEAGTAASQLAVDGNRAALVDSRGGRGGVADGRGALGGPYHLVNTNIVLVSSDTPKYRGRGGDSFILSPLFCGSSATGWASTDSPLYRDFTLATAMATSGAAVNPNAGCGGDGVTRQPVLSMLMGVLNLRLGFWLENPKWLAYLQRGGCDATGTEPALHLGNKLSRALMRAITLCRAAAPNFVYPGLGEVLARATLNEDSCLVQLSDGGHFENLGLYELVRRRLRLIIACDGSADPRYEFSDLANAIEKVRTDFGVLIMFEHHGPEDLIPVRKPGDCCKSEEAIEPIAYAKRAWLVGRIIYADNTEGTLLYLTTTFTRELSADLLGYLRTHPEYPDEPTSDQFFDEQQFEAYRELGYQTAYAMLRDASVEDNADVLACIGKPD